jgi:hypothetical protein
MKFCQILVYCPWAYFIKNKVTLHIGSHCLYLFHDEPRTFLTLEADLKTLSIYMYMYCICIDIHTLPVCLSTRPKIPVRVNLTSTHSDAEAQNLLKSSTFLWRYLGVVSKWITASRPTCDPTWASGVFLIKAYEIWGFSLDQLGEL